MDLQIVLSFCFKLVVVSCLLVAFVHLLKAIPGNKTVDQVKKPADRPPIGEREPVREAFDLPYRITIIGPGFIHGAVEAFLKDGAVVFDGDENDIKRLRSMVYKYHIENHRQSVSDGKKRPEEVVPSEFTFEDLWPKAEGRYLEAIHLAVSDEDSLAPNEWISVEHRKRLVA